MGVSFTIPQITTDFVLDSLRHIPTGKAVGLDGLSGYFLKLSAPSIASSLTAVFNLSLSSGSFPDLWKKAKVSLLLLFQDCKSSQTKTQNYLDKSRIKISTSLESNSVLESEFNNNVT